MNTLMHILCNQMGHASSNVTQKYYLGINPVTISARMNVSKQTLKNQSGGKDFSEKILFSLVDILSAYGDQIEDYQKHGIPITDGDLKEIERKKTQHTEKPEYLMILFKS